MPKLTSKVTMKIEPGLLEAIQNLADSEGLPVSSYIRKAAISYIGEQQGENPNLLKIELTELEIRAIDRLLRLGVFQNREDAFHSAFELYIRQEFDVIVNRAERMFIDDHLYHSGGVSTRNAVNQRVSPFKGLDLELEPDEGDGDE